MKNLLTAIFLLIGVSSFAQGVSTPTDKPVKTEKVGIAISKELQKDIKDLDDAMKPYEDIWREYNRLDGLKRRTYQTLIKARVKMEDLTAEPQISADSIKLTVKAKP